MAQQGWGSAEWSAVLKSHLALVMTPDVFVACLSHAMVKVRACFASNIELVTAH